MSEARLLEGADREVVEAYLAGRPERTMFLRSNLRQAGIEDGGQPLQGTYVGAFEGGALVGVAAHYWNGNVILAAEAAAGDLAVLAARLSRRPVLGLLGPHEETVRARAALGMTSAPTTHDGREMLYDLVLADLVLPKAERGTSRPVEESELDLVLEWRMLYCRETLGVADTPEARSQQRASLERLHARGAHFLGLEDGRPVSYGAFNAELPDVVQIGGVYTPPELRGRGYARLAVGGSLVVARERGVTRAILFTGEENTRARRSYEGLGFRVIGDYGITLFT